MYSVKIIMKKKNSGLTCCGMNDTDFKTRLYNRRRFFNNLKYAKDFKLSKYIEHVKDQIYLTKSSFKK